MRDTRSSCGGPLTWKAQIHDGSHHVNSDRNLPSSYFVVQYKLFFNFDDLTFTNNLNCICCEKGKEKTVFVTENFWSQSGSLFVTENFWSQSDSLCKLCGVI